MEVILQEDFPSLGYIGDRVSVRRGYARNFLLPRGIAVEASSSNAKILNHKIAGINAKKAKKKAEAEALGERIKTQKLEFKLKAGGAGKSFGSVTSRDVEAQLKEQGFEIDRRQVKLTDPLRAAGQYTVQIKLHSEVLVPVSVTLISDKPVKIAQPTEEASQAEDGAKAKKRGGKKAKAEVDAPKSEEA